MSNAGQFITTLEATQVHRMPRLALSPGNRLLPARVTSAPPGLSQTDVAWQMGRPYALMPSYDASNGMMQASPPGRRAGTASVARPSTSAAGLAGNRHAAVPLLRHPPSAGMDITAPSAAVVVPLMSQRQRSNLGASVIGSDWPSFSFDTSPAFSSPPRSPTAPPGSAGMVHFLTPPSPPLSSRRPSIQPLPRFDYQ
jgi:hypothetical protein